MKSDVFPTEIKVQSRSNHRILRSSLKPKYKGLFETYMEAAKIGTLPEKGTSRGFLTTIHRRITDTHTKKTFGRYYKMLEGEKNIPLEPRVLQELHRRFHNLPSRTLQFGK